MVLCIPEEKRIKAINLLSRFMSKRKAKVKEIQSLCGFLKFLNRAIHPGRVFMRHMYSTYSTIWTNKQRDSGKGRSFNLKPYHHIKLDNEFKADCKIWLQF